MRRTRETRRRRYNQLWTDDFDNSSDVSDAGADEFDDASDVSDSDDFDAANNVSDAANNVSDAASDDDANDVSDADDDNDYSGDDDYNDADALEKLPSGFYLREPTSVCSYC